MGLTLWLLVSVVGVQFGVTNRFDSGLVVVAVCAAGTLAGFLLRDTTPLRSTMLGSIGLIVGVPVTLVGLHEGSLMLFVVGSAVGGLGLGGAMSGSIRTLSVLPEPHERGEFFAGVYVVGYLAFSVPAVLAGFAATHFGLVHTTYVYGVGVVVLAVAMFAMSTPKLAAAPSPCVVGTCPASRSPR